MGIFDNKFFKIILTIFKILIFLILAGYILFIFLQKVSDNGSINGYRVYTVATASMTGVYNVNDVILVKNCNVNKLKVGDDITYLGNRSDVEGKIISHRIIKKYREKGELRFITKGVMNDIADPSISADQVIGKIVGTVPVVTQVNHIIRSQMGFFLLIFCPLVLVIVLEILQVLTEMRFDKKELDYLEKTATINLEKVKDKINEEEDKEEEHNKDVELKIEQVVRNYEGKIIEEEQADDKYDDDTEDEKEEEDVVEPLFDNK